MLNAAVGSLTESSGKQCILTHIGANGHAVYGPYDYLEPGYYAVEFNLSAAEPQQFDSDEICAWVDVAAETGSVILVREDIPLSRLQNGPVRIQIPFHNQVAQVLEFRVGITGCVPLLIEDHRSVVRLEGPDADFTVPLDEARFPEAEAMPNPEFFREIQSHLRFFYTNGATIKAVGNDMVVTIEGVSLYVREQEDLAFLGEIFLLNAYNFLLSEDCCVIDVGMNTGLASLMFASKPFIKEVHSFEPFIATYARAQANLGLNPKLASKIAANNFGLGGKDEDKVVLMPDGMPPGAYSIIGRPEGNPHHIIVKDAATVLKPIIAAAKQSCRPVIVKLDCEGSEYAICETLEQHGLLTEISAFMVEWHWISWQMTHKTLVATLARNGFIAFDLTHKDAKQGIFYAVKNVRVAGSSSS